MVAWQVFARGNRLRKPVHFTQRRQEVDAKPTGYRRLVRFALGLGIVTLLGGILWICAGAGIYGSPVGGAFQVNRLSGFPNYSDTGLLLVTIVGPLGMLAYALLEWWQPRFGAVAMMAAGTLVAEFGIRASRMFWGFASADALIVIGCISTPMLVLGGCLLTLYESSRRVPAFCIVVGVTAMLLGGISLRLTSMNTYWRAHCPAALERKEDEARMSVYSRRNPAPRPDERKEVVRRQRNGKQDGDGRQTTIRPEKSKARPGFLGIVFEKEPSGERQKTVENVKIVFVSEDGSVRVEATSVRLGIQRLPYQRSIRRRRRPTTSTPPICPARAGVSMTEKELTP